MFRIDVPSAVALLPDPAAVGTPGYFTEGDAVAGIPATVVTADFLNMLQEELISVLIDAGLAPSKTNHAQLLAAIKAKVGNYAGLIVLGASTTLTTAQSGYQIQTGTAGITVTMPSAAANVGKTYVMLNSSGGNCTIAGDGANLNSSYGSGFTSIQFGPLSTAIWVSDGTSWNAVSGSLAYGSTVKPTANSGVGQWVPIPAGGSTITLPAGGTWAYFATNAGIGYAGIAAGGSTVFNGTLNNSAGFCWRIA